MSNAEPPELPELSPEQKSWGLSAGFLFLVAVGLLGFSLSQGVMRPFAIGWVALQIFGYVGAMRLANGDPAHPLFKSQVILHMMALGLLIAVFLRGG
ncbi:MAG: pyridoxal phosphate biosynthetic protein [Pseudomonadota bacterium]|nr:pyridoxal phosphate biosynthetic protein [Pseudomonadota bacterium]